MQEWINDHILISYIIIVAFTVIIFDQVFRPIQRLPIMKEIIVNLVILFGGFVLIILQIDKLPIIQCMAVAVAMMLMLRGRQVYDKWKKKSGAVGNGNTGQS